MIETAAEKKQNQKSDFRFEFLRFKIRIHKLLSR